MSLTKSIFVTGAASGIGRETVRLFGANGWFVGMVDLDPEGLKSLETDIGSDRCFKRVMDVTDPEGYRGAAVAALTEALSLELERYGITVSDIIVPYVNTPMITAARSQAYSVQSTGINVQPQQVAKKVWKAAHGNKVHWKIHYLTYVLFASFWAFPFLRRSIAKYLCLTPVKHS